MAVLFRVVVLIAYFSEDNLIKPYEFCSLKKPKVFRFTPNYATVATILDKLAPVRTDKIVGFELTCLQLHTVQRDRPRDATEQVARIAEEHQHGIEFNIAWLEDLSERVRSH